MLKAGSTTRLSANLLGSMIAIIASLWMAATFSGLFRLLMVLVLLAAVHGLVLAFRLIDYNAPLVKATPDGLELDSLVSGKGFLPWDQIKLVRHVSLKGINDPFDWLDYVMIRTAKAEAFGGLSRLLPTTRLGMYFLPTRLLEGGSAAGAQFVDAVEAMRRDQRYGQAIAQAGAAPAAAATTPVAMAEAVSHDILTALKSRAEIRMQAEARAPLNNPSSQPAVRAAQAPLLPGTQPGKPHVAGRQDLGKAPKLPKSRNTGVLLNGKPLDF